jgi:Zn-dependent protease
MDATVNQLILNLALFLLPLIVAVSFHEFSHIAMARWLGDDTGTRMGRFTLDPTKHVDPIWTLALPAMLITMATLSGSSRIPVFAAGKPAPYNPMRLDRRFNGKRITLRTAELLVAIVGPISNLLLAFLCVGTLVILDRSGFVLDGQLSAISLTWDFLYLNVSLFVFNLIPIAPLDGSKVLISLLPRDAARKYEQVSTQLSFMLLGVLIFWGGSLLAKAVGFVVSLLLRPFF